MCDQDPRAEIGGFKAGDGVVAGGPPACSGGLTDAGGHRVEELGGAGA